MKPTKKGKLCLSCQKRPAAELGFCPECRAHLILSPTADVIDPRTGQSWPWVNLPSSPRTTA
jgi:hypothetical protein